MFYVRPLFSPLDEADTILRQARKENPKCPLHGLSTADRQLVRFIGHLDPAINDDHFEPWFKRLSLWIKQGKTPFLFVHTPDNREAPELARRLH